MSKLDIYRGDVFHFIEDPSSKELESLDDSYEYIEDGALFVKDGKISALMKFSEVSETDLSDSNTELHHYKGGLIMPGFIDTHVHYPQTEMIASHGEQLLNWLKNYTFPTEQKFSSYEYGKKIADFFLQQLIDNGTTTALVFGTVHPESVNAFFDAALARQMRMICGKVLMDRNAPEALLDSPEEGYRQSKELIEKWHGKERLQYAVTPRFAPTSSDDQLSMAKRLLEEHPTVYLHTHLSENESEVEWVKQLNPDKKGYLDVYDSHNLLGQRSVFAHCIHLQDEEAERLSETDSCVAFCPSSNLFLGSGIFNLKKAESFGYKVGLGTDVGAGTSFSLLKTMSDAYKSQQLIGQPLSAFKSFYLATLGGARALSLNNSIGNFSVGKEADFIWLNYNASPLLSLRIENCHTLAEKLFALLVLGDDRSVGATHILGQRVK